MENLIEKAKEYLYEEELDGIEAEAKKLSEPLIVKMAKKVIAWMDECLTISMKEDFECIGAKKFFDQYSIEIQSLYVDEIIPGLGDVIDEWIAAAFDEMNPQEKFILDCSVLEAERSEGLGQSEIYKRVRTAINELAWKHYNTAHVQDILRKASWL